MISRRQFKNCCRKNHVSACNITAQIYIESKLLRINQNQKVIDYVGKYTNSNIYDQNVQSHTWSISQIFIISAWL